MTVSQTKKYISSICQKAGGLPSDFIFEIELPPKEKMGDVCISCFKAGKEIGENPKNIAQKIVKNIKTDKLIEKVESAGPYVNFYLNTDWFKEVCSEVIDKGKDFGQKDSLNKNVVVEFSSPNTNKPQHLGHLRNNFLGWSMSQIFEKLGYNTIKANLVNDRGVHICKSMLAYKKWGKGETPKDKNQKPDHFVGDYYVLFNKKSEENPELLNEAQEMLTKWENGDKETISLWKKMKKWAMDGFKKTYKNIGISFDKWYWESNIYKQGKKIVKKALKKGNCYKRDDGAVEIDLSQYNLDKKVLIRPDGTSVYITQDIGLAKIKQEEFQPDLSVYVVGSEQNYHFKVLFKTLKEFGFDWFKNLYHLSYGMIDLPDGKMKSREGNVVEADELVKDMTKLAKKEIKKRNKDISGSNLNKRAHIIALAALKFYLLKFTPKQRFTFKPEESISFEGDTGPYILYTYARIKSILRKSSSDIKNDNVNWDKLGDPEKQILKTIFSFSDTLNKARKEFNPTYVCTYLLKLCHEFNEFYHKHRVIQDNKELKKARLIFISCVAKVLKSGLDLLGINTIEEM